MVTATGMLAIVVDDVVTVRVVMASGLLVRGAATVVGEEVAVVMGYLT